MASRSSSFSSTVLRNLRVHSQHPSILHSHLTQSRSRLLPLLTLPQPFIANKISIRNAHSIPRPPPPTAGQAQPKSEEASALSVDGTEPTLARPPPMPNYYQISFTCVPCGKPSVHNISKQGYHHGSILITCPTCRNRHIISDHLNIFGDRKVTIEDIMREKGQLVKRGSLGEDGDIEFWPDERYDELKKGSDGTESS
ncbi:DNL zinc finger-domain-containing protein [Mariannaea sp. PMI_226]|nr:DNL zinc finger-domain-containing protein [Mariannaea sp. PMI_226]